MHIDEKYYEEPDKFDPDRFNDENLIGTNQINQPFYPFGDGPRNCIGTRFAKMQMKFGLVTMLKNFKFELDEELKNNGITFNKRAMLLAPTELKLHVSNREKSND